MGFIIGLLTGSLGGLLGIGGGAIMIAAMVLLLGMNQVIAQETSLLCMVPAGAVGAFTHWRLGNIHTKILPGLLPGIMIGAYGGGSLAYYMPGTVLGPLLALAMLWIGIRYLKAAKKPSDADDLPPPERF
jgi:hypothetical protein